MSTVLTGKNMPENADVYVVSKRKVRLGVGFVLVLFTIAVISTYTSLKNMNESGTPYRVIADQKELEGVEWWENVISIEDADLTDASLSNFLEDEKIEDLGIDRCTRITAKGLQGLERSDKLTHLNASYTAIGDDVSSILSQLHMLEHIGLSYIKITELSAEVFDNNPHLLTLELEGCRIARKLIERCAKHPQLRILNLSNCTGVKPEDYVVLAKSKSLRNISLAGSELTIGVVDKLCNMSSH